MKLDDNASHSDSLASEVEHLVSELDEVRYDPYLFHALLNHSGHVITRVHLEGFDRHTKHHFVQNSVRGLENATSIPEIMLRCEELRERFMETGLFKDIDSRVEPAQEGGNYVVVRLIASESAGRKQAGISTDLTGSPEIKISAANIMSSPYTVVFEYLPTNLTRSVSALTGKLQSYDSWLGRFAEYSISQGSHDHGRLHALDNEVRAEAKTSVHFGPNRNRSILSLSATHSSLNCTSKSRSVPHELAPYKDTLRTRLAARYEWAVSTLLSHSTPHLRKLYAHPVQGHDFRIRCELAGGLPTSESAKRTTDSSGLTTMNKRIRQCLSLGGTLTDLRLDSWCSKHFLIHPLVTAGVWLRTGMIFPLGEESPSHKTKSRGCDIHLLDRYFMDGTYVRGYKFIGPHRFTNSKHFSVPIDSTIRNTEFTSKTLDQLGGTLLVALSSCVSFPLPLSGGLFAGHVFANAGTVQYIPDSMRSLFHPRHGSQIRRDIFSAENWYASIGAGLLLNEIPVIGSLTFGRLEINFSIPFQLRNSQHRGIVWKPNSYVFDRFRFGLNWVYQD